MLESTGLLPILFRHAAFNYSVLQHLSTEMRIPITLLFALLIVQQGTFSEFLALNCIAFEFNVPRTKSNIKPVKALISA